MGCFQSCLAWVNGSAAEKKKSTAEKTKVDASPSSIEMSVDNPIAAPRFPDLYEVKCSFPFAIHTVLIQFSYCKSNARISILGTE